MYSYGLKEEIKNKKKVDVSYYRMKGDDIICSVFTNNARKHVYFRNENNNKLFYIENGKKIDVPFIYSKDLFFRCEKCLYPIGSIIFDKCDINKYGEVLYYNMENDCYIINKGNSTLKINFNDAIVREIYYFVSSSGKVQRDYVGRDENAEKFRKATNNYFENKADAEIKRMELFASIK